MDEGWAALAAGGFGVLGALIGGAAAVWGARQQVQVQATAEHHHWSRQMRREAYEGFIAGAAEVIDSMLTFARAGLPKQDSTARDDVELKLNALLTLGIRVSLAGPDHMEDLAKETSDALDTAAHLLLNADSPAALEAARNAPALSAAAQTGDRFTKAARLELQRSPHQS